MSLNILFIHQNFPGQFLHLAPALAKRGHQVVALGNQAKPELPGVTYLRYAIDRSSTPNSHAMNRDFECATIRGEAVSNLCLKLHNKGFQPDVIYVHPGWGEGLFLKDIWPETKLVVYCEYFYGWDGQDVNFDPEFMTDDFTLKRVVRLKNTANLHAMQSGDVFISPTRWQKSTYPDSFREKIRVIHEGVDVARLRSMESATVDLPMYNLTLTPKDRIITFVARNLEPMRGFHVFMRSLPLVFKKDPTVRVVIIGGDDVSYGNAPPGYTCWRDALMSELGPALDHSRIHFLGKVDYDTYLQLLKLSNAHVYLTYPFVLSWSFIEALVMGIPIIASDTAPVREFVKDNKKLIPFFDTEKLAQKILRLVNVTTKTGKKSKPLSQELLHKLDMHQCLDQMIALIESLPQSEVSEQARGSL